MRSPSRSTIGSPAGIMVAFTSRGSLNARDGPMLTSDSCIVVPETFGDPAANRVDVQVLHHLVGETVDQQSAGFVFGDAARTHVVQGFFVELANSGAVLARHFIGEDLQPWCGVDLGLLREQEIGVGLFGIGAVCARTDIDAAIPNAGAGVVEHTAVGLAACAVLGAVDHGDLLVEGLGAETEVEPR